MTAMGPHFPGTDLVQGNELQVPGLLHAICKPCNTDGIQGTQPDCQGYDLRAPGLLHAICKPCRTGGMQGTQPACQGVV